MGGTYVEVREVGHGDGDGDGDVRFDILERIYIVLKVDLVDDGLSLQTDEERGVIPLL